jgi:tRNA(adenine34) deaminase
MPHSRQLSPVETEHLRAAFALARQGAARGNDPFGARLVGADGQVHAEAHNTVATSRDCTAHAEINLIRRLPTSGGTASWAGATLYTSAEPCAMCAGAICWSGIGRIVFGLSAERVRALHGPAPEEPGGSGLPLLQQAATPRHVLGPALESEAAALFN